MKLNDIFTLEELEVEIDGKFVNRVHHKEFPLAILNYTNVTQFANRWNNVTENCRGLIYNTETLEIIARGPRKFYNYGQTGSINHPLDTKVVLTTKHDGSLGIMWEYEGTYGVATRGSFYSDQAIHATALMDQNDKDNTLNDKGFDYSLIVEIVYPENRIVLDYGKRDELIFLGVVDNASGLVIARPNELIKGEMTLAEAIALPIPDDEEGYVLDIYSYGKEVTDHIKLKGDFYKELHSTIFGLSERSVWENYIIGKSQEFVESLPDELQEWAINVVYKLEDQSMMLENDIFTAFDKIKHLKDDRRLFANEAKMYGELAGPLFAVLDGNHGKVHDWVNKKIYPAHRPFAVSDD